MTERLNRLYRRFFRDAEHETEDSEQQRRAYLGRMGELMRYPAYRELRQLMDQIIDVAEPRVGSERDMLYQIGYRDGAKSVRQALLNIESEVKRSMSDE